MGCLELGLFEEGFDILHMLLPATHDQNVYRVEPYVLAADVYTAEHHVGRGGWSWYTGSASWYYRAVFQNLLGIHIKNGTLTLLPRIPKSWDGFGAVVKFMGSRWNIRVSKGEKDELYIDGNKASINTPIPPGTHDVLMTLGRRGGQIKS